MFSFKTKKSNRQTRIATRVVKSSRWIPSDMLEVGMYVSELDVAWEETRFMFQGFFITDEKLLRDVQDAAQWVFIDTEKVAKVPADSTNRLCGAKRTAGSWS